MSFHPSLRVSYRILLADWLKEQGLPHDATGVDRLIEKEADWIETRNLLAAIRPVDDKEFAFLFGVSPSTVPALRADLVRSGEWPVADL